MSCLYKYLLYAIIYNPIAELTAIGYGHEDDMGLFPRVGDVFITLQSKKIFYCKVDGIWTEYTCVEGEGMEPTDTMEQPGAITTIADNSQTTIVSYTNNTGDDIWLSGCIATGTVDGEYVLTVNGDIKGTVRSSEQDRNGKIVLEQAIKVINGDIITVKVTHWHTYTADFKATIYMYKY